MDHVTGCRGPRNSGSVADQLDQISKRPGEGDWWLNAPTLAGRVTTGTSLPGSIDWYRLGDGMLGLRSDDEELRQRFGQLYGECLAPGPPEAGPVRVLCTVRSLPDPGVSLISFEDPEPLDQVAFAAALFPQRGYAEIASPQSEWRLLGTPEGTLAIRDPEILVRRTDRWQLFIANVAIHRVLRLQRDVLFFHAASVAVRDAGLLLVGPRGAGKTTLSMAIAARGHDFLGDEMAGVRRSSLALVPIRRAVSVRPGPRAPAVDRALTGSPPPAEAFPDGTPRIRADIARLFPQSPGRVAKLRGILFLRGFAGTPRLERLAAGPEQLEHLPPMGSTLWGVRPALRGMQILSMMARVPCWSLHAGTPDATADLIEHTVEE